MNLARSWMVSPVQRQQSLQIRRENRNGPGSLGILNCTYEGANTLDTLNPGIPGRLTATYTNTNSRPQTVTINSIENFDGTIRVLNSTANLNPGQQITGTSDLVPAGAAPYDQTIVITVNGQQFNLVCSFILGSTSPTTLAPQVVGP
ncbi:MAG: hypothetical protein AAGA96_03990 [Verrucomicrobiota bacterium]